jgi:hypothetical protein
MTPKQKWRTALVAALALASLAAAVAATVRALQGPPKRFEPQGVPSQLVREIDALTSKLLALASEERQAQLRQAMAPGAPPHALESLNAQLESMKQAAAWKLAAADGYGPLIVKAIYDLSDGQGNTRQIALILERRAGKLTFLDVAR